MLKNSVLRPRGGEAQHQIEGKKWTDFAFNQSKTTHKGRTNFQSFNHTNTNEKRPVTSVEWVS